MKRAAAIVLFLAAATLTAAPCVSSPSRLCLNGGRFAVDVVWKDFQANTGAGHAISLTTDTGYFWFFSSSNVELVVKVVDGRPLNGNFWVFYGALSNVEYTMTVTDSVSGHVKTYTNPSGNFGSVGDTSAFSSTGKALTRRDDSGPSVQELTASTKLALREALLLDRAGPSNASIVPNGACVPAPASLCLNNNRFRVEVSWTDFAGNTGVGTAVSLTGDTGYFWFFSDNNVELTVKALDARVLNGRFWVFYGALSNVQYEMTVTDTLTGNVNTYANSSGRFASVGDTGAFPAGFSVATQLDVNHATSAEITTAGGTVSATAGDGTVFTLTIPPDALLSDETVTLTPVLAINGLPLSGGLAGAVDLAPTGLRLFKLATLTIAPPAAVPLSQKILFGWRGSGEEFFLHSPATATPGIALGVMHFNGYGVGRGSAADEAAQQARPPASPEDALDQRLQGIFASKNLTSSASASASASVRRTLGVDPDPGLLDRLEAELQNYYDSVLAADLEAARTNCTKAKSVMTRALSWSRQVQLLTSDPTFLAEVENVYDAIRDALANCYNEAFTRCVDKHDPSQLQPMLSYTRQLQLLGGDDKIDPAKIERCVRFELDFETVFEEVEPWRHHLKATVPLTFSLAENNLTGTAPLVYTEVTYTGPDVAPCSQTTVGTDSTFQVTKTHIDFNNFEGNTPPPVEVTMEYDPGHPNFAFTLTCPGAPVGVVQGDRWRGLFGLTHMGDASGSGFLARNWAHVGGSIYARKTYQLSAEDGNETTIMDLKHTPQ